MDYKGQMLCEYIYSIICVGCTIIAWIAGWYQQNFYVTFQGWCIGMVLSLILCIPDWPMYNRNKVSTLQLEQFL